MCVCTTNQDAIVLFERKGITMDIRVLFARSNVRDREKYTDSNDPRLDFLLKMATVFKRNGQ